jgi:predicted RNase H-like HicB family nuclease
VGIYSDGDTPWQARDNIRKAISEGFEQPLLLEYREQIAEKTYIDSLVSQV